MLEKNIDGTLVVLPVGPGRGQKKELPEALRSLANEMKGHIRDLRGIGDGDGAELLERYTIALEIILLQITPKYMFGTGQQAELAQLAKKYRLDMPQKERINKGGKPFTKG
jgi:hypothetical protein